MSEEVAYFFVLLFYFPGLWLINGSRGLRCAPLLLFAFFGMFFFNALGSVLVMTRHYNYFGSLLAPQYVAMLILQVLLFYAVAVPYLRWKENTRHCAMPQAEPSSTDTVFLLMLGVMTVIILALYLREAGQFLIVDLVRGRLNAETVLEYRTRTYGLANFRYYRLGFLVLPALIGAHLVLTSMRMRRIGRVRAVGLLICFVPPLLMAEKAGVLYLMLVLLAAWFVSRQCSTRLGVGHSSWRLMSLALILAIVPTGVIYLMYYAGSGYTPSDTLNLLLFRTFGAYTESMAAAVPFAQEAGWLHGRSLPNLNGLFPWERVSIEAALHYYMTQWAIKFEFSGLVGSSSIPAVAEGYINFGWGGFVGVTLAWFLILVFVQEILDRLRPRPVAQVLCAWYAYLALTTALTGLFATLVSFIHTVVALAVYLLYLGAAAVAKRLVRTDRMHQ